MIRLTYMNSMKEIDFENISMEDVRGAVVFLDIDGTITHQRGREYTEVVLQKIEEIKQVSDLFFATNSRDDERSDLLLKQTSVPFIKGLKPWVRVLKQVEYLGDKRRVVIGDKTLIDGVFALFIGAKFIRVKRKRGEHDLWYWRIFYWVDDAVSRLVS